MAKPSGARCGPPQPSKAAVEGTLSIFEERAGSLQAIVEQVPLQGDLTVSGLSLDGATLYMQTGDGIELGLSRAYDSDTFTVSELRGLESVN